MSLGRKRSALHPSTDEVLSAEEQAIEPPPVETEDPVEQAAAESFPASDPPSFTPTRAGKPDRNVEP